MPAHIPSTDLRLLVAQHQLPVHIVLHGLIPLHQHLRPHPLVPVKRLRARVQAMRRKQLPLALHVRPRRTQVRRRTRSLPQSPQQLHLNRDRKILVHAHRLYRLPVHHNAAIARRPARPTLRLLSDKPVLHGNPVIRKLVFVKQMPELVIEVRIPVITNRQIPIHHTKCIRIVRPHRVPLDLRGPSLQIFAIEQRNPVLRRLRGQLCRQ